MKYLQTQLKKKSDGAHEHTQFNAKWNTKWKLINLKPQCPNT